jgi:hypothetical protein
MGKRYTRRQAERLLARLVTCVEDPRVPASTVKATLIRLLEARMGDIWIAEDVIERLRGDSPAAVKQVWLSGSGLRALLTKGRPDGTSRLPVSVRTLTVSAASTSVEIEGPLGNMFAIQLLAVLRLVGPRALQTCDCGRRFVRVGKRRHCSERCQKRIYMRRFRAGETEKE